jgi:hypothetical protein
MQPKIKIQALLFLSVLIIFGSSCQTGNHHDPKSIEIKINKEIAKDYQLHDAISITRYLALETNDSCLIGKVIQLKYEDSCFYINSRYIDLFRFNSSGLFLNSISHRGRGPDEFQFLSDFNVDPENNRIEIFSDADESLKEFSKEGVFLSSQKFGARNSRIAKTTTGQYFIYIRNNNYIGDEINSQFVLYLLEDKKDPNTKLPVVPLFNRYLDLSGSSENFWQNHDQTFFYYGYNDTIYQFSENKLTFKYHIDFGNNISIKELGKVKERINAIKLISDPSYSRIGNHVYINERIMYIDYDYRRNTQKHIINRINNQELNIKYLMSGIDTILLEPLLLTNDSFISLVDPIQIIKHPDEFIRCGIKREFVNKLTEDQNPIIIYYTYK